MKVSVNNVPELGNRIEKMQLLYESQGWKHKAMMRFSQVYRHDYYLRLMDAHLDKIDEDPLNIDWVLKDGIWQNRELCDIIVFYKNGNALPLELIESERGDNYQKAKERVLTGIEYATTVSGAVVPYGKVVVYDRKGHFQHKTIK